MMHWLSKVCLVTPAMLVACGGGSESESDPVAGTTDLTTEAKAAGRCDAPIAPGTDRSCSLVVGGRRREVLIYAPRIYDPRQPAALVVDAHGAGESAPAHAGKVPFRDWPGGLGSGWRLLADREGFLVVQPQGLGNVWTESDADFMLKIPETVALGARVDPRRVFLTGISNGGALTYWTACRDTAVYRAFAPISAFGVGSCPLTHHAPLIHFHSPDDVIIPLTSGRAAFDRWVESNHCRRGPVPAETFGGPHTARGEMCLASSGTGAATTWRHQACSTTAPEARCEVWDRCDDGVEATFCLVPPDRQNHYATTGGHILYINSTGLALAAATWKFFERLE